MSSASSRLLRSRLQFTAALAERRIHRLVLAGEHRRHLRRLFGHPVGDLTTLAEDRLLEPRDPIGERLAHPIAMRGDRRDRLADGFGKAIVECARVDR